VVSFEEMSNYKNTNKKAVLSQRRPCDAPYIWVPWKISGVAGYAHGYFSEIVNGFCSERSCECVYKIWSSWL